MEQENRNLQEQSPETPEKPEKQPLPKGYEAYLSLFDLVRMLAVITLVLGVILVICPFQAFTTVVRLLGAFLLYDGLSDLWITGQVGKAVRQTEKAANAEKNAVDVEYRDVKDE